jgi:type IV pilus assembly protein PilA
MKAIATLALAACLIVVAIPQGSKHSAIDNKKTCRANEQTIANAVQASRVEHRANSYSMFYGPVRLHLLPDLQSMPICPDHGRYSILRTKKGHNDSYKIHCSIHGDFEPGKDRS